MIKISNARYSFHHNNNKQGAVNAINIRNIPVMTQRKFMVPKHGLKVRVTHFVDRTVAD